LTDNIYKEQFADFYCNLGALLMVHYELYFVARRGICQLLRRL